MSTAEPSKALPPPSTDNVITGTGPTAFQATAVDAEESQPPSDSETTDDEPIKSYIPKKKKKEILRILSWPDGAFYEFLGLPESATKDDIMKTSKAKFVLTHTDQNDDKYAKMAFQRIGNAKDTLLDPTLRRVEEAHITDHNAPVVPIGKAGKKRREQLAILDSDQNRKAKENAIRELRLLQENFRDLLKNLELPPSWVYDVPVTIDAHEASQPSSVQNTTAPSTASQRPSAENRRTSNPSAATDRYNNQSFDPMDTTGNSTAPSAASQRPSARNRQTSNPSAAAGRSTGRAFDPMDTTDNSTAPSAASQRSSAENRRTSNPSAAADRFTDQSLFDAMDTTPNWTPGETTRGEEIIAFRPVTMTGIMPSTGETGHIYSSIRFVIKSEGRNPIEIVNEAR
ncbi:DnaJ domain-containing protein, partial [Pyrenophora tritici-repentis]